MPALTSWAQSQHHNFINIWLTTAVPTSKCTNGKSKYSWVGSIAAVIFICMSVHACATAAAAVWQSNTAQRAGWIIPNTIKGSSTRELRPWQRHIQRISQPVSYPLGTAEAEEKGKRNRETGGGKWREKRRQKSREGKLESERKVEKRRGKIEGRWWLSRTDNVSCSNWECI